MELAERERARVNTQLLKRRLCGLLNEFQRRVV